MHTAAGHRTWLTRSGVGVAAAALALTACGSSGPKLNGAEKQTSTQVSNTASAALRNATSVHLAGTSADTEGTETIDLEFQGKNVTGFVQQKDQRIEITRIGTVTYVRAPKSFYTAQGNTAAAELIGDKWVKTTPAQAVDFQDITLDSLGKQFFSDGTPKPGVTRTELNGAKAVTFVSQDSTKVWVANTGAIRPLRAEKTGSEGGLVNFTEWGNDFKIAAPAGAIDASKLG